MLALRVLQWSFGNECWWFTALVTDDTLWEYTVLLWKTLNASFSTLRFFSQIVFPSDPSILVKYLVPLNSRYPVRWLIPVYQIGWRKSFGNEHFITEQDNFPPYTHSWSDEFFSSQFIVQNPRAYQWVNSEN